MSLLNPRSRLGSLALGLVVGGLILLALAGLFLLLLFSYPLIPESGRGAPPHPHGRLLRGGELIGRSRSEVIAAVGPPARESLRSWYDLGDRGDFDGLRISLDGDPQRSILLLHFDREEHRLVRARAHRLPKTFGHCTFSPQAWAEADPEARRDMLRDLLSWPLTGHTRASIESLLGPPDGSERTLTYEDASGDWFEPTLGIHLVIDDRDLVVDKYHTDY